MSCNVEKTANEFKEFLAVDMHEKLTSVEKLIDDMHARLEEFQTMIYFASQERITIVKLLESISNSQEEFNELFKRIDSAENLVNNVKSTLSNLEAEVEKAEEDLGINDITTIKVANIFTPLFKKTLERSHTSSPSQVYKAEDYFISSLESKSVTK